MGMGARISDVIGGLKKAIGENSMMSYVVMMSIRLLELHRILKPTGSLYLHCDPTASHYLKVILDSIFTPTCFRNEIIWHYKGAAMTSAKKVFPRKHDTILFYSKGDTYTFNPQREDELSAAMKARWGQHLEPDGESILWGSIKHEHGQVKKHRTRLEEKLGRPPRDDDVAWIANPPLVRSVWTDLPEVRNNPRYSESLGYPTQKPLALLERVISAGSNRGDLVLDPFCGCGTTVHAAQRLEREWIGIDITHLAIGLIEYRLQTAFGVSPRVIGVPVTFDAAVELARRDKFQFEAWAVTRIRGVMPNERQVGDRGIDGRGRVYFVGDQDEKARYAKVFVSVKGGERLAPSMISELRGVVERDGAEFGVFVCLKEPTKGMKREAALGGVIKSRTGAVYPRIQIYTIQDYFAGRKPVLPAMEGYLEATGEKWREGGRQSRL